MSSQPQPGQRGSVVETGRRLYRRLVPERIRNPIGLARRGFRDRLQRALSPGPLPPRSLLRRVQMTPWISEYLEVGGRAAASLRTVLESVGADRDHPLRVLDLGCGVARVTRHFLDQGWEVHGCDIDAEAIAWARRAFPSAEFAVNQVHPPLPYDRARFDVVVAVSVFTHFEAEQQTAWCAELARVVAPGGIAVLSTMGPELLDYFAALATPEHVATLARDGFLFARVGPAFNEAGAFHDRDALAAFAGPDFELEARVEKGLDDFQDLSVLRRRTAG